MAAVEVVEVVGVAAAEEVGVAGPAVVVEGADSEYVEEGLVGGVAFVVHAEEEGLGVVEGSEAEVVPEEVSAADKHIKEFCERIQKKDIRNILKLNYVHHLRQQASYYILEIEQVFQAIHSVPIIMCNVSICMLLYLKINRYCFSYIT